jgi:hypothetical protein
VVTYNAADHVEFWTRPHYLYGDDYSISCFPTTEVDDGKVKVILFLSN